MSDQTKYVNSYVESAISIAHEQLNAIIQLKTQLKLANDLNAEKDNHINQLQLQLKSADVTSDEYEKLKKDASELRAQNHGLANKASHIDTFKKQIIEMKRQLEEKDGEIHSLKVKLGVIPKPNINKKKKSKSSLNIVEEIQQPLVTHGLEEKTSLPMVDDF